jgi:uncharacterized membrane protein YcaP (DUF421 family)
VPGTFSTGIDSPVMGARLFTPEMSLPEVAVRGTLVYVFLVLLFRVILRRQAGKVSLSDLLVVAIVAGVWRNPLVRDAYSVTDGMLVVLTVVAWSYGLDWLGYHIPMMRKLLHPNPIRLVQDGSVLEENLARDLMTESQLHSKLRREGISDVRQVGGAWIEGDGHVSVVPRGHCEENSSVQVRDMSAKDKISDCRPV